MIYIKSYLAKSSKLWVWLFRLFFQWVRVVLKFLFGCFDCFLASLEAYWWLSTFFRQLFESKLIDDCDCTAYKQITVPDLVDIKPQPRPYPTYPRLRICEFHQGQNFEPAKMKNFGGAVGFNLFLAATDG
jgi:hypothetical protein